jgi:hypothetical protein
MSFAVTIYSCIYIALTRVQEASMSSEEAIEQGGDHKGKYASGSESVIASTIPTALKSNKSIRRGSIKARPKLKVRLDAVDGDEGSEEEDVVMLEGSMSPSRARAQVRRRCACVE